MTLKNLLITTLMITSLSSFGQEIICTQGGRWQYPVSADAVNLAQKLKVKTCNNARFETALELLQKKATFKGDSKKMAKENLKEEIKQVLNLE
jgi:hypothetical protein